MFFQIFSTLSSNVKQRRKMMFLNDVVFSEYVHAWTLWKALNRGAQFYIFFLFAASWWSALEWYVKGLRGAWFRRRSPPRAAAVIRRCRATIRCRRAAHSLCFAKFVGAQGKCQDESAAEGSRAKIWAAFKVIVYKPCSKLFLLDQCRILWSHDCGTVQKFSYDKLSS